MKATSAAELENNSSRFCGDKILEVQLTCDYVFQAEFSASFLECVTFEFARRNLTGPKTRLEKTGTLSIHTAECGLRLEQPDGAIVFASNDPTDEILENMHSLVGNSLARISVVPPGGDTAFHFGDGRILRCLPARTGNAEIWTFRLAGGETITLGDYLNT